MLQFPSSPTGRIIGSSRKWRGKTLTVHLFLVQYHTLSCLFFQGSVSQQFQQLAPLPFPKHVLAPHSKYMYINNMKICIPWKWKLLRFDRIFSLCSSVWFCAWKGHNLISSDHHSLIQYFQASSQNCEERKLASSCLSVRVEQLGS